jgi:hypothetical protein
VGVVWGRELDFDGTKVEANADFDTLVPRFFHEAATDSPHAPLRGTSRLA